MYQVIKNLNNEAKSKGLVFINEIGLDPGIDHFFTHLLVNDLNNQNLSNINVKVVIRKILILEKYNTLY